MPEAAGPGAGRSALHRAESYRLHAAALLTPTPKRRAALVSAGRTLLAEGKADLPWREPFSAFLERLGSAGDTAESVHIGLFEVAMDGVPCPPLAAHYLHGESQAWGAVPEVEELARRLGVVATRSLGGRADHASVELEMLSILARHEARALESGDAEGARAAQAEAERFLVGHVLQWFPRFEGGVRENDSLGVAAAATASAMAFLRNEQARLGSTLAAEMPAA